MLHKSENMITADFLLRLLRLEKKLKHIEGVVIPLVKGDNQGYQIKIASSNKEYLYSFFIDPSGNISVYIDENTLELLDGTFISTKEFSPDQLIESKEYIVNAIITAKRNTKFNCSSRTRYEAL
jgi:hypothetical protein